MLHGGRGCGAEVAVVDVRQAHLGHGAGPPVPQVAAVVVQVTEPYWLPGHRVGVDGRLRMLDGLQPEGIGPVLKQLELAGGQRVEGGGWRAGAVEKRACAATNARASCKSIASSTQHDAGALWAKPVASPTGYNASSLARCT